MLKSFFTPSDDSNLTSFGLLVLRLGLGLTMFVNHGLDKLRHFSDMAGHFADPLGIGPKASFALVVFAEVAGALLITIGLLTRFAALVLVIDMGVAFFMVHKTAMSGPHSGELAFIYLAGYVVILLAGAGSMSADKAAFSQHAKPSAKH
jgi:putative oxidoreductase